MPEHAACRHGVESLHEFFLGWYTGQTSEGADTHETWLKKPGTNGVTGSSALSGRGHNG